MTLNDMKGWTEDDIEQARGETEHVVPAKQYDSAVAIDPGTTTGVAVRWKDGDVTTSTLSFWDVVGGVGRLDMLNRNDSVSIAQLSNCVHIVEAPYLSKWAMTKNNSPMAYNSGQVAREAELLVEGLERRGLDVIEHDPSANKNSGWTSGKWDSETAHKIVGDWEGPDNEHVRDAIRILFIYNFI